MHQNKIKTALLFLLSTSALADDLKISPFQVPTFEGNEIDFKKIKPAVNPAKTVDADLIVKTVNSCYPVAPMHLEVGLRAGSTYRDQAQNQQILSAESANYYAGIVATMPLYSGVEIDREQKLAIDRKLKTAEVVAQLLNALSAKRRAERMIKLYASLEKRSQIRVRDGIVAVDEQIGYLEKVATTQGEIDTANAQIEGARLALIHQCQSDDVERLNNFILSEIN